jgi:hypothetical protein
MIEDENDGEEGPNSSKRMKSAEDESEMARLASTGAKLYTLQSYYYGWVAGTKLVDRGVFPPAVKCPLCSQSLTNNIQAGRHLLTHVMAVGRTTRAQVSFDF